MDRTDALEGRLEAVFPTAETASDFYDRINSDPSKFLVLDLKRNRVNGRKVTWRADMGRCLSMLEYWKSMCETVGYYGSSFGEPPTGAGRKTAYLNGMACPASM